MSETPQSGTKRRTGPQPFKWLFSSPEITYTTFSNIATILGFLVALYFYRMPEEQAMPNFVVTRDVFVVALLILMIIFWVYKFARASNTIENLTQQIVELQSLTKYQTAFFFSIAHAFRDSVFAHLRAVLPTLSSLLDQRFYIDDRERKAFENVCSPVTLGIREALLKHFLAKHIDLGDDISVCIKLILPTKALLQYLHDLSDEERKKVEAKEKWVLTVYRDPVTHHKCRTTREVATRVYDIERNTAFTNIVNSGLNCFACDDLRNDASYVNENTDWNSQYNSTMVVPIRYADDRVGKPNSCVGLLAVDSLNSAGHNLYQNNEECRNILTHSADLLAHFFLSLTLFQMNEPAISHQSEP